MNLTWSCFPKFFQSYSLEQLAEMANHVGLDTLNVVVREGYAVEPNTLTRDLPRVTAAMRDMGMPPRFATAAYHPRDLLADESILAAFGASGIRDVRIGYYNYDRSIPPGTQIDEARHQMAELASQCGRHGVRVVIQAHHGKLFQSPSAVHNLVKDLSSSQVGVMLDPGNQWNEGWENWHYAANLLSEHLTALGVKDAGIRRGENTGDESKGWSRHLGVPLPDGVVNWYEVMRALKSVSFNGTLVFMPFYHNEDQEAMTRELKREVAYLRGVVDAVEQEEN